MKKILIGLVLSFSLVGFAHASSVAYFCFQDGSCFDKNGSVIQATFQGTPSAAVPVDLAASIGMRPSPINPTVIEYFNRTNGVGFSSPQALADFMNTLRGDTIATVDNVFALYFLATQVPSDTQPAPTIPTTTLPNVPVAITPTPISSTPTVVDSTPLPITPSCTLTATPASNPSPDGSLSNVLTWSSQGISNPNGGIYVETGQSGGTFIFNNGFNWKTNQFDSSLAFAPYPVYAVSGTATMSPSVSYKLVFNDGTTCYGGQYPGPRANP